MTFSRLKFLIIGTIVASVITVLGFVLTMAPIPMIEGYREVFQGEAFNFKIGMTKEECFVVIKNKYSSPDDLLRIEWYRAISYSDSLISFENTVFEKRWQDSKGIYEEKVNRIDSMTIPFKLVSEWELRKSNAFINHVRLEFQNGRLVKLSRNRWLYERP